MAKFVKVILFLLLTVAFHSIAGNVSTAKVVDEQERAITYAMRQRTIVGTYPCKLQYRSGM